MTLALPTILISMDNVFQRSALPKELLLTIPIAARVNSASTNVWIANQVALKAVINALKTTISTQSLEHVKLI